MHIIARITLILAFVFKAAAAPLNFQADLGVRVAQGFKVSVVEKQAFRPSAPGAKTGPDGARYVLENGRLLREGKAIASGFRNAQDFDFNSLGDIFAFDGDVASDFYLPWHVPARLFHVGIGQHHCAWGGWDQPDYYADRVDILMPIGRATPGRVICYRHTQFPEEYRDSIFIYDREFGKIYFCKLQRLGSTYRARTDLFFESDGFRLSDMAVAQDGSLLISDGSRVLQIENMEGAAQGRGIGAVSKLQEVLRAPQPLEAWSRARWIPAAKDLGPEPFRKAVNDLTILEPERVRAVEIHTELFGALPSAVIDAAVQSKSATVRARAAWALAWQADAKQMVSLQRLSVDIDATVRRFALEGILHRHTELATAALIPTLRQNLAHPDKRLRQCAAAICARLPEVGWRMLWEAEEAQGVQVELSLLLAAFWREPAVDPDEIAWRVVEAMPLAREAYQRQQCLRLLQKSLGDWNLNYEPGRQVPEDLRTNILDAVREIFPAGSSVSDLEASRVLAMLEDDSFRKVGRFLEGQVSPVAEFHYLIVLSRFRGQWPEGLDAKVNLTLRNLDSRLQEPPGENWRRRKAETEAKLAERSSATPPASPVSPAP